MRRPAACGRSPSRPLRRSTSPCPAEAGSTAVRGSGFTAFDSLAEQFSRYPRHHGVAALREATRREPARTRSEAERRLLELIRAARLPEPQTNARVGPYEADFLWPEARLVVEVDGYAFHSTRAAFERDRRRDAELQALGQQVMRVTWRQIEDESEALFASLALAYGQRMRGPA
jgi:very-short-patch-repair endonuclease